MSDSELATLMRSATGLLQASRLPEAVPILHRITTLKPQWPDAYIQLGSVLHNLRRFNEAAKTFAQAVRLAPTSVEPLELWARSLLANGNAAAAEKALRRSIDLDPKALNGPVMLLAEFLSQNRLDDAHSLASHALAIDPAWPPAIYYMGLTRYRLKRYRDAEWFFAQAVRILPDPKIAVLFLARSQANLGRVADGEALLRSASARFPEFDVEADRLGMTLKAADFLIDAPVKK